MAAAAAEPRLHPALEALPFALALLYLVVCPFHKVEESFHLQATHDVLVHAQDLAAYDHQLFPGPVPRTFLGALALALAALPARALLGALALPKLLLQVAVRGALAAGVCVALRGLLRAVARAHGARTAAAAALALCASPHYLYYASRTLPNTFAMLLLARCATHWVSLPRVLPAAADGGAPPATLAGAARALLRRAAAAAATPYAPPSAHLVATVAYFCAALLWFRCDLLAFLAPAGASWLLAGRASLAQLAVVGAGAGAAAIAATVAVDTVMWGACAPHWACARGWLLWPELNVLLINTGTAEQDKYTDQHHAWHWYFSSALPKSLLGGLAWVPLGLLALPSSSAVAVPQRARQQQQQGATLLARALGGVDWAVCELALPALAYPALLSLLRNKQLRFVLPVYPLLYVAAGSGMAKAAALAEGLLWGGSGAEAAGAAPEPAAAEPAAAGGAGKRGAGKRSGSASRAAAPPAAGAAASPPPPTLLRFLLGWGLLLALAGSLLLSSVLTAAFVYTNHYNYPGGRALQRLYSLVAAHGGACLAGDATASAWPVEWSRQCLAGDCANATALTAAATAAAAGTPCSAAAARPLRVHVSNLAAQTGVSRFGEPWALGARASLRVSKTEGLRAADFAGSAYDYLLAESAEGGGSDYALVAGGVVEGLAAGGGDGWQWSWRRPLALRFTTSPQVFILQRVTPFAPGAEAAAEAELAAEEARQRARAAAWRSAAGEL